MEETAKLTVKKLVAEHASRDVEVQTLEEREKQLKHELEMTRQRAGMDKRVAHAVAEVASAVWWGWLRQWVVAMMVGLVVL